MCLRNGIDVICTASKGGMIGLTWTEVIGYVLRVYLPHCPFLSKKLGSHKHLKFPSLAVLHSALGSSHSL